MLMCPELICLLFSLAVESPSGLKFKILNENTVQMTWKRPLSQIDGFRILVTSDTGKKLLEGFHWLSVLV